MHFILRYSKSVTVAQLMLSSVPSIIQNTSKPSIFGCVENDKMCRTTSSTGPGFLKQGVC